MASRIEKAKQLLNLAIESGFKYSGIKSITMKRAMVEIMSTERMDVPVGREGVIFCSEPYLDFIISKANFMLERGKEKLGGFIIGWRGSNKTPSREEMVYQKNLETCIPFFNI